MWKFPFLEGGSNTALFILRLLSVKSRVGIPLGPHVCSSSHDNSCFYDGIQHLSRRQYTGDVLQCLCRRIINGITAWDTFIGSLWFSAEIHKSVVCFGETEISLTSFLWVDFRVTAFFVSVFLSLLGVRRLTQSPFVKGRSHLRKVSVRSFHTKAFGVSDASVTLQTCWLWTLCSAADPETNCSMFYTLTKAVWASGSIHSSDPLCHIHVEADLLCPVVISDR